MSIDYFSILHKYVDPSSELYKIYVPHVTLVTNKALAIARRLDLSQDQQRFIEEAGYLHDIGVVKVKSEKLHTIGNLPYVCHGVEGNKILLDEGLPEHGLVAERHTGVGITLQEIEARNLPLPRRDLVPQSLAEKIITYADKFFSKRPESMWEAESVESIRTELAQYGQDRVAVFDEWHRQFGGI